jgi:hypothetical protein
MDAILNIMMCSMIFHNMMCSMIFHNMIIEYEQPKLGAIVW